VKTRNAKNPFRLKTAEKMLYSFFAVFLITLGYWKLYNHSFDIFSFIRISIVVIAVIIVFLVLQSFKQYQKELEKEIDELEHLSNSLKNELGNYQTQLDTKENQILNYQRRIRHFLNYYQLFIQNGHEIISLHDMEGHYNYISPSITTILGYPRNKLAGESPYDICHDADRQTLEKAFSFNGVKSKKAHIRLKTMNGEYKWFEILTKLDHLTDNQTNILSIASEIVTADEVKSNADIIEKDPLSRMKKYPNY